MARLKAFSPVDMLGLDVWRGDFEVSPTRIEVANGRDRAIYVGRFEIAGDGGEIAGRLDGIEMWADGVRLYEVR